MNTKKHTNTTMNTQTNNKTTMNTQTNNKTTMNSITRIEHLSQLVNQKQQARRHYRDTAQAIKRQTFTLERKADSVVAPAADKERRAKSAADAARAVLASVNTEVREAERKKAEADAHVQDLENNWPWMIDIIGRLTHWYELGNAREKGGKAYDEVQRAREKVPPAAQNSEGAEEKWNAAKQELDAAKEQAANQKAAAQKAEAEHLAAALRENEDTCRKISAEIGKTLQEFRKAAFSLKPAESGLASCIPWGQLFMLGEKIGPAHAKLPIAHGMFTAQTPQSIETVLWMVRDILSYSKAGSVQVTVIDTYEMGRSFHALFTDPPVLEGGKIYTDARESASVLDSFAKSIAELRRDTLGSRYATWDEYRTAHPETPLPYRILILANAEDMLASGSAELRKALSAIMREGPQAGILPVYLLPEKSADKRAREAMGQLLHEAHAVDMMHIPAYISKLKAAYPHLRIEWQPGFPKGTRGDVRDALQDLAAHGNAPDCSISRLLAEACTAASSEDGVSVPVGWDAATNAPAMFMLDDAHPHAFIGGQTGMGKSNFMHVLLHAWMKRYSADELQIYILDFKEGVEMHEYARYGLPHVQLVARKCDMDFATSLLEHLQGVNEERAELFRAAGVTCIEQYRRQTGRTLPRIVLLVDECQNLFNQDSMGASETISRMATQLVRTGRSQGIHLVLSCQSLSGMTWNSPQLWSNIRVRVALKCMERESRSILSESNRCAAQIIERKQAVLNLNNGEPEDNMVVNVPLADVASEPLQEHLQQLEQPGAHVREYCGAAPLPLPEPAAFASQDGALWPGNTASLRECPVLLPFYDADEQSSLVMLACMGTADAAAALREAAVRSATAATSVEEAIIIYRQVDGCPPNLPAKCRAAAVEELTPDAWRNILSPAPEGRSKLLYIQALDRMQGFLKFPDRFATAKAREGLGAMLADALENADETRLAVIADCKRMPDSMLLKDIRPHFSSFLVQGVAEEDARRFLGRVDMKPTGMGADPDSRCKARLVHLSQELVFRPFMQTAGAAV